MDHRSIGKEDKMLKNIVGSVQYYPKCLYFV